MVEFNTMVTNAQRLFRYEGVMNPEDVDNEIVIEDEDEIVAASFPDGHVEIRYLERELITFEDEDEEEDPAEDEASDDDSVETNPC
jgi:hypothetical protein